jgi:hypothetical protein
MAQEATGRMLDWDLVEGPLLVGRCDESHLIAEITRADALQFQLQIWRSSGGASPQETHLLSMQCMSLQHAIQAADSYICDLAPVAAEGERQSSVVA